MKSRRLITNLESVNTLFAYPMLDSLTAFTKTLAGATNQAGGARIQQPGGTKRLFESTAALTAGFVGAGGWMGDGDEVAGHDRRGRWHCRSPGRTRQFRHRGRRDRGPALPGDDELVKTRGDLARLPQHQCDSDQSAGFA